MDELKQLWHTVFGDDFELIDRFFDTFYSPALCATKFVGGKLCAAAYVMPVGELVYDGKREKCAHIYAVAVYPEYRGRGYGIEVTKKAAELAGKAGYTAVLHPADEGLFGFYEIECGHTCHCYACTNHASLHQEVAHGNHIGILNFVAIPHPASQYPYQHDSVEHHFHPSGGVTLFGKAIEHARSEPFVLFYLMAALFEQFCQLYVFFCSFHRVEYLI